MKKERGARNKFARFSDVEHSVNLPQSRCLRHPIRWSWCARLQYAPKTLALFWKFGVSRSQTHKVKINTIPPRGQLSPKTDFTYLMRGLKRLSWLRRLAVWRPYPWVVDDIHTAEDANLGYNAILIIERELEAPLQRNLYQATKKSTKVKAQRQFKRNAKDRCTKAFRV